MKPLAIFLLILFALSACKKPVVIPTPESPSVPLVTAVGNTIGDAIQQIIGASGGSITSADGKITLDIPAGALESNQNISIQPIENKIPTGIKKAGYRFLPHGLQFRKPAKVTLHYSEGDIANSSAEALSLATQMPDGKWRRNKSTTAVDKIAKTVTTGIGHFSDWDWFLSLAMKVGPDVNEGVYSIDPGDHVEIAVVNTVDLDGQLIAIMPIPSRDVSNWAINGQLTYANKYGALGDVADKLGLAVKKFEAPINIVPDGNLVAISVEVKNPDPNGTGQFMLVANLLLQFENSFKIDGNQFRANAVLAYASGPNLLLELRTTEGYGVAAVIEGYTGPGTYQFATPGKGEPGYIGYTTRMDAVRAGDQRYINWKPDPNSPAKLIYSSGTVTVHSGAASGDILRATINGNMYKTRDPYTGASVAATINTKML